MRLPRLTTRRLMVIVAVVGLTVCLPIRMARMAQQRDRLSRIAIDHANWEHAYRGWYVTDGVYSVAQLKMIDACHGRPNERMAAYHHSLFMKYRRAARYPWLPVPPDQPEPK
jgi:hypothetical protein